MEKLFDLLKKLKLFYKIKINTVDKSPFHFFQSDINLENTCFGITANIHSNTWIKSYTISLELWKSYVNINT